MVIRNDIERDIWAAAYRVHQMYADKDLAHDGHGIWLLAGECLRSLVNAYDRHPLACKLMQCMVEYYSGQYREAHAA